MKKQLIAIILCLFFIHIGIAQEIITHKPKPTKAYKNSVSFGYDFYTFDDLGAAGLYPTLYSASIKRKIADRHSIIFRYTDFTTYATNYLASITKWGHFYNCIPSSNSVIPVYSARVFLNFHLQYEYEVIKNWLNVRTGGIYRIGYSYLSKYSPGVGHVTLTKPEDSYGFSLGLSHEYPLGRRFYLEPHARYEYYFQGTQAQYEIGLQAGFRF